MKMTTRTWQAFLFIPFIALFFTNSVDAQTYCASKGTFPWEQWIANVWVSPGTFNNASSKEGYADFRTRPSVPLQRGRGNLFVLTPQASWGSDPRNKELYWRVWIDFNGDGDFADADEQVISGKVNVSDGIFFDNERGFAVPATARLGSTRLRVALKQGGFPEPCETFERGEVEDYTAVITDDNTPIGRDTLHLVGVSGDTAARQGGQVHLNITIRNTGTGASDPNTPLSIYAQMEQVVFKGPPPSCFQIASNRLPIGRSLQPNETVTLPFTFTMANDFTDISPQVYPSLRFIRTDVLIGNRLDYFCHSYFGSDAVVDTLYYPHKINALLDSADLSTEIIATDTTYTADGVFNFTVKITNNGSIRVKNVTTSIRTSPQYKNPITITPQRGTVTASVGLFPDVYYNIWNVSELAVGESLTAQVRVVDTFYATRVTSIMASSYVFSNQIVDNNTANNLFNKTFSVTTATNYCAAKGLAPWEMWISNIKFNTLNNTSDKFKDYATLGYSNYTNITTTLNKGQTYPLSITPALSWSGYLPNTYCRVWIDFNKNNVFEDSEKVLEKTNINPLIANVLIPTTAATGDVRMRVAVKWGSYPTPCETFEKGEVEDYTVQITEGVIPNTCRYQDSLQLVSLYNAANGANWTDKWNLNTPINTWYGVELNANGCVTGIRMENNNLDGTLPNLDMPNLMSLNLRGSKLHGTLPNLNCPNLIGFYLTNSQITGSIPNFNFPNLQVLMLYANQLTGPIPNFNFPNLTALLIDGNQLSGTIPNFNFPKMKHLALAYNQLSGSIPDFNFPDINQLYLDSNRLSGCIPLSMKAFCGQAVNISNNQNLAMQSFTDFCSVNNTGACANNVDIAVSLAAVPSVFTKYAPMNFTITAKNNGSQVFTNVKIEFKFPTGTTNGGAAVPSVGTWQEWCSGGIQCFTWTIPTFGANGTATLNVPIYVLNPTSPMVATAKLLSSTPTDGNVANNVATISVNQTIPPVQFAKVQATQLIPIVIQTITPNPSENEVTIDLESLNNAEVVFDFVDAFGKVIKTENRAVERGRNYLFFDVSNLPQGVYFLSPTTNMGRNMPIKFVKM